MSGVSGQAVTRWFAFMEQLYAEVRALNDQLSNSLSDALEKAGSDLGCVVHGRLDEHWATDDGECLCVSVASNQALKKNKKSKTPVRWLGWQISLAGDGVAIPNWEKPEPLLHVFCWSNPVDFDEAYMCFPFDSDEVPAPTLADDRLIVWGDANGAWNERQWTYSLRLFAIKSPRDLDELVVRPALGLLRGGGASQHLVGERFDAALVRYPSIKQLMGMA